VTFDVVLDVIGRLTLAATRGILTEGGVLVSTLVGDRAAHRHVESAVRGKVVVTI